MSAPATRVLILEDQPLIVMDVEDSLVAQGGFEIVGILSSCASATEWLENQRPDVVILDIELRDGVCVEVAKTLVRRQIPFVVHSGSPANSDELDSIFLNGSWVEKPSFETELVSAVRAAAASALRLSRSRDTVAEGQSHDFLRKWELTLLDLAARLIISCALWKTRHSGSQYDNLPRFRPAKRSTDRTYSLRR